MITLGTRPATTHPLHWALLHWWVSVHHPRCRHYVAHDHQPTPCRQRHRTRAERVRRDDE